MKRLAPFLVVFCLCITYTVQSQTDVNKDIDIAKVYEQVVKEGYGTPAIYLKLANEYYFKSDFMGAKKWYEKVFEQEKISDKVVLFRYKQTLKALDMTFDDNPYLAVVRIE